MINECHNDRHYENSILNDKDIFTDNEESALRSVTANRRTNRSSHLDFYDGNNKQVFEYYQGFFTQWHLEYKEVL